MFNKIKAFFMAQEIFYLDKEFVLDKSSAELIDCLENQNLSRASGNMIVIELFKRALRNRK